jgi:type IV pilus assembly protein PilC
MTTFAYTALEPSGKKKHGFVDAATREAAIQALSGDGRFVLEIHEQAGASARARISSEEPKRRGKVNRSDIALFTRRMSDLAEAGLPLDRVLQVIAEQSESAVLTEVAEQALSDVRAGMPVSQALAQHPKLFPTIYTETLKAGEASGQFAEVSGRLADFQEKEVTRRSQIVSALIYPSVLAGVAVFVVVFLILFVVPRLVGVFDEMGDDLPATTRVLLATTEILQGNWMLILAGIVGGGVAYRVWSATEHGATSRDAFLLRAPLVGPIVRKATVSRFSRVLGTLVYGGVPILESLRLAGLAAGNRVFGRSAAIVEDEVREGRSIAEAMRDAGAFPPVLTHMVAIGEETGDLPKMLGRVSDSLDFEVDNAMRRLTSLVEPVIVVAMGAIVAFVVLSVVLPIIQAPDLIR